MFCDQVKIRLVAGKGGDGCKSFRREAHVPFGGPNGGDGGKGGDIFLIADSNINTLSEYNTKKICRAENGERGGTQEMTGKNGGNLILKVPCGTMVFSIDHSELLADLSSVGDTYLSVRGGKGGKGNSHFSSSTRQTPNFAELGEPGQEKEFFLELRLVADCGIIGIPSVGKSTLISKISNARPKIADYPFTTLIPNLGIVELKKFVKKDDSTFVIADIPGLIEGASEGKGLGHDFLRHISRTATIVHVLDASSSDIIADYKTINKELEKFDKNILLKEQIVVVNKIDILNDEKLSSIKDILKKNKIKNVHYISAATGENLKKLVFSMWENILKNKQIQEEKPIVEEFKIFKPHLVKVDDSFSIEHIGEKNINSKKIPVFEIKCRKIEQIVSMTDFESEDAVDRIYDVINKLGITKELLKKGAKRGDLIKISEKELEFLG